VKKPIGEEMLTTAEAALLMQVEPARVRQLANTERIPGAVKYGRDWMIPRSFAESFQRQARGWPKGRPRKSREDES